MPRNRGVCHAFGLQWFGDLGSKNLLLREEKSVRYSDTHDAAESSPADGRLSLADRLGVALVGYHEGAARVVPTRDIVLCPTGTSDYV